MGTPDPPKTIQDLAQRLGVSSMTVHRAIAGKPDISERTRSRIMAEVTRLGWRPNMAARGLRLGKTHTLGILVSNVAASFLPEILQGVDAAAERHGYHSLVCVHEHDPRRAETHLRTLLSKGCDGIVCYPTSGGEETPVLNEVSRALPLVAVMRRPAGFEGPSVVVDDRAGGRLAAERLLRLGRLRPAFLGYRGHPLSQERREGYREALAASGLLWELETEVADDAAIVRTLRERLTDGLTPDGLFCASDRLAARALQAASAAGIRVPETLSIIGYNGEPWAELLSPALTTIEQPRREIGERAAALVLGPHRDDEAPADIRLSPRLVERES